MKPICTYMLALAIGAGLLSGCGSEPREQGGGWGEEATNTRVGLSLNAPSLEVDACTAAGATASADITATVINPSLPPNTLTLSRAEISYTPLTSGAPPIAAATEYPSAVLPASGVALPLLDAGRKIAYLNAVTAGGYLPSEPYPQYLASYTLSGTDSYGSSFGVRGTLTFRTGRYGTCPFMLLPGRVQLGGLPNPDGSALDDVTYHIIGGRPPYTVYSDALSVVPDQGTLAAGVMSFTADPDPVIGVPSTTVTLTAVDADGLTSIAILNVISP